MSKVRENEAKITRLKNGNEIKCH